MKWTKNYLKLGNLEAIGARTSVFGMQTNLCSLSYSEDQKSRIDAAKLALVTIFRSWPGNVVNCS